MDSPREESLRRLSDAARPGRVDFRSAAFAQVLSTGATIALLGVVAALITHGHKGSGGSPYGLVGVGLVAVLVRAGALATAERYAAAAEERIVTSVRARVIAAVLPNRPTGASDASAAANAVIELPSQIGDYHRLAAPTRLAAGPSCLLVLIAVALIHWPVAVLLLLAVPIVSVNLRLAGWAARDAAEAQLDEVRRLSTVLLDQFRGLPTLRTLGAVDRSAARMGLAADALNRASLRVLRRAFVGAAILDTVVTFAIALSATYVGMTLLGYVRLPGAPELSMTRGLLVLLLVPVFFGPLRAIAAGYHERDLALAAADRLSLPDVEEPAEVRPGLLRVPPRLVVTDLGVRFADSSPLLESVDLVAEPGQFIALTGPSGAGKSTLLTCLAGLRPPTSGSVWWRRAGHEPLAPDPSQISWIGQATVLFSATLADNIRLADPAASPDAVANAATAAGLAPLLARLADGLATEIHDGGGGISAGEARRVALARALLRDAPLWLLDEPTAHLDAQTEEEILRSLGAASVGRTVVIATHSARVIAQADVVWRVDRHSVNPIATEPVR